MSARLTSDWLTRASAIAMGAMLATVAATPSARAQSFNGSSTVVAGSANVVTGASTTDITIFSPQVVIDWTPTDSAIGGGPINFQSAGTTATFQTVSSPDFAVLNRIVPVDPSRPVQFNGTVNGKIGVSFPVTGGKVYFYSPGGIILGASARVDVGALGLSTASPAFDPSTGDFINSGAVTYNTAVDGTAVVINNGAQITAPVDQSSYVAVFAPIIRQDGLINVNGSTALVAGGAGKLTWNSNGLFDVEVTVGTDGDGAGTAIAHSGTTGGSVASASGSDLHRVYMVAVPKNNAITTMITSGSTLGFDIAAAADTFGNTVVLSAGFDQSGDAPVPSAGAGSGAADITVTNTNVTSNLIVVAKGTSTVRAASGGVTALAASAYIEGGVEARLESSSPGSSLTLAGNLTLTAANFGDSISPSVTGGTAYLTSSNGASLTIGGSAFLDASAGSDATSFAGSATGGTARVDIASGGLLSIGSDLAMNANGSGSGNGPMGNGTGGLAEIVATGSGVSISIGGTLLASARGFGGGSDGGQSGFAGGAGVGGVARIVAQGSNNITVQGTLDVNAGGTGGDGNLATSGTGTGGQAIISIGAGSMLDARSDMTLGAVGNSGMGFNALDGGAGNGGIATLETTGTGAVIQVGGALVLDTTGISDGTFALGGNGGLGTGGTARILGAQGSVTVASITSLIADGFGGSGDAQNAGFGGNSLVSTNGGTSFTFSGGLSFRADGKGGADLGSDFAGNGTGGNASLVADGNSNIAVTGALISSADGYAGAPNSSGGSQNPGNGQGGTASIIQNNAGLVTVTGSASASAIGQGGHAFSNGFGPATAGTGTGGNASILVNGSNEIRVSGITQVEAMGLGGTGLGTGGVASGGAAFGGFAQIIAGPGSTGSVRITDATKVDASATGGSAFDNGAGGDATGGQATIGTRSSGASVDINAPNGGVIVTAEAHGGTGNLAGAGGNGTGGRAEMSAFGGTMTGNGLTFIVADGFGGDSVDGTAGTGRGGRASVLADSGGNLTLTIPVPLLFEMEAVGVGGSATGIGNGGLGVSGIAEFFAQTGGAITVNGDVQMVSAAHGGGGANGGDGDGRTGPEPRLILSTFGGTLTINGDLTAFSDSSGGAATVSGGSGGAGYGGSVSINARTAAAGSSSIRMGDLFLSVLGVGGDGGGSGVSFTPLAGGAGGAGVGGSAIVFGDTGNISPSPDNGLLTIANASILASGLGGAGGAGDDSLANGGPGGDGGAGGSATGGSVRIGTMSSVAGPSNSGGAVFGNITADSGAIGGTGGSGGSGPAGFGNGGTGGLAIGSISRANDSRLMAAGGSVSASTVFFSASAVGGDGGAGTIEGNGGDATAGEVDIVVDTGPSGQRGALSVGAYFGTATATGGLGNVTGADYFGGGSVLAVQHGTFTAGNVQMLTTGAAPSAAVAPLEARIFLLDSLVSIGGVLDIQTPGAMSVFSDSANLSAASLSLAAGDFVPDPTGAPAIYGTLSAGTISILSGNNIILGASLNSTASTLNLTANGLISVLDLTATGDIFAFANGPITASNLESGNDITVDSAGMITIGKALAANAITLDSGNSITAGQMDAGSVVLATAAGGMSVQDVSAAVRADLFAQGRLGVNGIVSAPRIAVRSNDITIGVNGGLDAGASGSLEIFALNSAGVGIGDGLIGAGYLLDNSEFSRLKSGTLAISAIDVAALPIDMRIGDLDVTGPLVDGGTIGLPDGSVTFFTGDIPNKVASGAIRVVGSLRARNFGADNALVFNNAVTEVDAELGMIEILGTGSDLAGAMEFLGQRIHVAQASILDQLQQDPFYAGRVTDLNTPLATPRPNGVIRAQDIGTGNAVAILIQNSGSALLPAGFFLFSDGPIGFSPAQAPGSVELIVNGQLLTPSGLITGVAVHDHLVDDANRPFFSSSSTINGCLVSVVACAPVQQPDAVQADDLAMFDNLPPLSEPEPSFAEPDTEEERKAQEEGAEAGKRAPISPPAPLINTRPLDPPLNVDEPVAGSGNPALIGAGVQP